MNLGDLIDFCGNLLDYDPVNTTYREQLVALLNDSQTRLLTDRHWSFAQKERTLKTFTDQTFDVALNNGSAVAIGIFPPTGLMGALIARQSKLSVPHNMRRARSSLMVAKGLTISSVPIFMLLVVGFVIDLLRSEGIP